MRKNNAYNGEVKLSRLIKRKNVNRLPVVSIRECVNLVKYTNFNALCVLEADFSLTSSMLEKAVISWNAGLPNTLR